MISIELVTNGDISIMQTIASIKAQTYQDFEVIIIDSSPQPLINENELDEKFRVYRHSANLLSKRYQANCYAEGEFVLLLEGTRILSPDCLSRCVEKSVDSDMLILPEGSIGRSFVSTLIANEKRASLSQHNISMSIEPQRGFVLPRFFRKSLLDRVFDRITSRLTPEQMAHVFYGDHSIINVEAQSLSSRIGILTNEVVFHYEDETLIKLIRKYYGYGRSNKILAENRSYRSVALMQNKIRIMHGNDMRSQLYLYLLSALKGIPFWLGYLL